MTRRQVLAAGATAGVGAALAGAARPPAALAATCPATLPGFPAGIDLARRRFVNWAKEIVVDDVWTCEPRSGADVLALTGWAARSGYRLRARGMMHGWSPLVVTPGTTCSDRVVLLDTTRHLTAIGMSSPTVVRAQAGVTLDTLLAYLQERGLGLLAAPAPGDITIGGALAIDAHGTAIPADGERRPRHQTFGSLSNLVVSMTVVSWDRERRRYRLRRIARAHRDAGAFLVHLGRAFVVEVELRVAPDVNLRCISITDIPVSELLAPPAAATGLRTLDSFLRDAGRAEVIWYAGTDRPWLKVWSVAPTQPAGSRAVTEPYNYPFSDQIPEEVSDLADAGVTGAPPTAPVVGSVAYAATVAGLAATDSADLWGPSRATLQYIRPTTLRATANGYAVLCRRADVQQALADFAAQYRALTAAYAARDEYPVGLTVEIRLTGLDRPGDVGIKGARGATLSALHPRRDHPEWDVAVWFDVLTFPTQPASQPFLRDLERWFLSHFMGDRWTVRVEWSKGWGYSGTAPWADEHVIERAVPASHTAGRAPGTRFADAVRTLDRNDPHRVFTNPFLSRLLRVRR